MVKFAKTATWTSRKTSPSGFRFLCAEVNRGTLIFIGTIFKVGPRGGKRTLDQGVLRSGRYEICDKFENYADEYQLVYDDPGAVNHSRFGSDPVDLGG